MHTAKSSITTVAARRALAPRKAVYWHPVAPYIQVGYYKPATGTPGTWHYRTYFEDDTGVRRQVASPLGDALSATPPGEQFAKAQSLAIERAQRAAAGVSTEVVTVRRACQAYVDHLRDEGSTRNAADAEARFKRWVFADAIATIDLSRLRQTHLEDWRKRLRKTPVTENPHARRRIARAKVEGVSAIDLVRERPRSEGSVNRDLVPLRAALNRALDQGVLPNDLAWRIALKPAVNADGQRDLYLTREQRRHWVGNADADVATFLKALALVPLRPGAMAALRAGDFNVRTGALNVERDKAGADRQVLLTAGTAAFFGQLSANKLPAAPLVARADGSPWTKDAWKKPVKAAAQRAGLPAAAVAYTMRHSTITDLVTDNNLDLLTIARLAGTSVVMIEKHYGHLRQHRAAAALEALNLW